MFAKVAAALISGVMPGTALYAAAVLSLEAAMSFDMFAVGKLKPCTLERTLLGREVAYLPFVTLLKIAVAIAPKRRRAVPARPAAVPLLGLVSIQIASCSGKVSFLHVVLVQNAKSNQDQRVEDNQTGAERNEERQNDRSGRIVNCRSRHGSNASGLERNRAKNLPSLMSNFLTEADKNAPYDSAEWQDFGVKPL